MLKYHKGVPNSVCWASDCGGIRKLGQGLYFCPKMGVTPSYAPRWVPPLLMPQDGCHPSLCPKMGCHPSLCPKMGCHPYLGIRSSCAITFCATGSKFLVGNVSKFFEPSSVFYMSSGFVDTPSGQTIQILNWYRYCCSGCAKDPDI